MQHDWVKSNLGHGNQMCRRCFVTDLEAEAIGMVECDPPPPKAANQNERQWTQDEIDEEMLSDDEGEKYDESEECGRWNNGGLSKQCRLAGTEWCDWCCPIGLRSGR